MPTIDARYLPWILIAILVSLIVLNIEGALFLMRRQDSSVWVANADWLKQGERITVEIADPGLETLGNQEQMLRSVLNDCQVRGSVIMSAELAVPNLQISCLDLTPAPPPGSFTLPSMPGKPKGDASQ